MWVIVEINLGESVQANQSVDAHEYRIHSTLSHTRTQIHALMFELLYDSNEEVKIGKGKCVLKIIRDTSWNLLCKT